MCLALLVDGYIFSMLVLLNVIVLIKYILTCYNWFKNDRPGDNRML